MKKETDALETHDGKGLSDGVRALIYKEMWQTGLISQWLQLKRMYIIARASGRQLLLAMGQAKEHYGDVSISACDIFNFTSDDPTDTMVVRCINSTLDRCSNANIVEDMMVSNVTEIRYCGHFVKMAAKTNRDAFILATSISTPKLRWVDARQQTIARFTSLLMAGSEEGEKFTVVHWRRGDQLVTRCIKGRDYSVNCGKNELQQKKLSPALKYFLLSLSFAICFAFRLPSV
jgi:hypothetical protein